MYGKTGTSNEKDKSKKPKKSDKSCRTLEDFVDVVCPRDTVQVGGLGADIAGCGLTRCEERYVYPTPQDCEWFCRTRPDCRGFTFAPIGGDKNHPTLPVCTIYNHVQPRDKFPGADGTLQQIFCRREDVTCPPGTEQAPGPDNDIARCGLTSCDLRYTYNSPEECEDFCLSNADCKAFSFAAIGVDRPTLPTCTIYDVDTPSQQFSTQIFCKIVSRDAQCPARQSAQVEDIGADIPGCGLTDCDERYAFATIEECELFCRSNKKCEAYTFAPIGGDINHPTVPVCTLYDSDVPTDTFPGVDGIDRQVFCRLSEVSCPRDTLQVGGLGAGRTCVDFEGFSCAAPERTDTHSPEECQEFCRSVNKCNAFTFAPEGGENIFRPSDPVCTLYENNSPNDEVSGTDGTLQQVFCKLLPIYADCPPSTVQVDGLGADIPGCGLTGSCSNPRPAADTPEDCETACRANGSCKGFTFAPINGDQNNPAVTVCTIYGDDTPTAFFPGVDGSFQQIFCRLLPECPANTVQVGGPGADIPGCGLTGSCSNPRPAADTPEDCETACRDFGSSCKAFTFAPINGDQNNSGVTVCTLYEDDTPTSFFPGVDGIRQQIFCKLLPLPGP